MIHSNLGFYSPSIHNKFFFSQPLDIGVTVRRSQTLTVSRNKSPHNKEAKFLWIFISKTALNDIGQRSHSPLHTQCIAPSEVYFDLCLLMWAREPAVLFGAGAHLLVWCRNLLSRSKLNKQYKGSAHHRASVWECVHTHLQCLSIVNVIRREMALFKIAHVQSGFFFRFMQLLRSLVLSTSF